MPRIRMLHAVAGVDVSYGPGDEIDVSGPVASAWAAEGLAEVVTEKATPEKATPRSRGGGRGAKPETR